MNSLLSTIKSAHLRLTPQRVAICDLLEQSEEHPTAQEIYDQLKPGFPSLSLATVYNTLDALTRLGAINALGGAGDDRVHYDADTHAHVNLACTNCNRVIDFPSQFIHEVEEEVQRRSGYHVMGARVMYYGLCPDCQQKISQEKVSS